MLLKIILVIVFVKILIDYLCVKEGFTEEKNKGVRSDDFSLTEDVSLQSMGGPKPLNYCNTNIIFPKLEVNKEYPYIDPESKRPKLVGSFSDGQNLFNALRNIKKAANPEDCDKIISS